MKIKKSSLFLYCLAIIILVFAVGRHLLRDWPLSGRSVRTGIHLRPERRNEVVRAIEKALPSVVNIGTERVFDSQEFQGSDDFDVLQRLFDKFLRSQKNSPSYSLGSGCIIDASGLIVTNAHVVERAAKIMITLNGGGNYEAEVVADDPLNDIALLKLKSPPPGLRAIRCDKSGRLYLGETVIAVGNPFGLDSSITVGALSGTSRRFTYRGKVIFSDILQTDAIVYPGNSGGPLINIEGNMIGMNMSSYENAPGIGFAIPLTRIENVLAKWMIPERFGFCSLGIVPGWAKDELGQRVVTAADILPGSPAARAGLKKGVRIFRFDGRKTDDLMTFSRRLIRLRSKDEVTLDTSDGKFQLTVAEMPRRDALSAAREQLALDLTPATPAMLRELDYPVETGLLVTGRLPDTPADIRRGDLLLKLGSATIHSAADLDAKLRTLHYNDSVNAVFLTSVSYGGRSYPAKKEVRLTVR
ncbi:MAG: trypsin-like peptidase domain-containing protein [Lentisphaeria bacterium]|nr:trypsin-like peptidase domain-containing protein [Lentisphaeria bacterium]